VLGIYNEMIDTKVLGTTMSDSHTKKIFLMKDNF
jgi:hypothetical protein